MSQDPYDAIRKRVTERYQNRAQFLGHLIAFVIVNALAWMLIPPSVFNASDTLRSIIMGILFLSSAGWLLGLVIHGVNYLLTEMRERAIDREIERERQWQAGEWPAEKPKRDLKRLVSEDGELLNSDASWEERESRGGQTRG